MLILREFNGGHIVDRGDYIENSRNPTRLCSWIYQAKKGRYFVYKGKRVYLNDLPIIKEVEK